MSATKNYICQLEEEGAVLFGDPNMEAAELFDAEYQHRKMLEQAQEEEETKKENNEK